ncbi:MAG: hypothetical protein U0869_08015 [Chloroflexota bacterium]
MRLSLPARKALQADMERLHEQQLVVIALDRLTDLLVEPEPDFFTGSSSVDRAGIDEVAATLIAARKLPESLTVRVVLPAGTAIDPSVADAQAALNRRGAYLSTVAWRDSMAIRSMGYRQLPIGLTVAVISWIVSAVATSAATTATGGELIIASLLAMIGITIAWVVSWMVVEYAIIDWRPNARRADAYDLLSRATLEVVNEPAA